MSRLAAAMSRYETIEMKGLMIYLNKCIYNDHHAMRFEQKRICNANIYSIKLNK